MNSNAEKKVITPKSTSWVCCPECGKKNRKSALACDVCRCEQCGADFRAYVVKGTVMVVPFNKEETEVESYNRTKNYLEQLVQLANVQ